MDSEVEVIRKGELGSPMLCSGIGESIGGVDVWTARSIYSFIWSWRIVDMTK